MPEEDASEFQLLYSSNGIVFLTHDSLALIECAFAGGPEHISHRSLRLRTRVLKGRQSEKLL